MGDDGKARAKKSLILWHGTSWKAACAILRSGFDQSTDGCLGAGFYFAARNKAVRFARSGGRHHSELGGLVKAAITFTNPKHVDNDCKTWQAEGHDACRASRTSTSGAMEWCVASSSQVTVCAIEQVPDVVDGMVSCSSGTRDVSTRDIHIARAAVRAQDALSQSRSLSMSVTAQGPASSAQSADQPATQQRPTRRLADAREVPQERQRARETHAGGQRVREGGGRLLAGERRRRQRPKRQRSRKEREDEEQEAADEAAQRLRKRQERRRRPRASVAARTPASGGGAGGGGGAAARGRGGRGRKAARRAGGPGAAAVKQEGVGGKMDLADRTAISMLLAVGKRLQAEQAEKGR